MATEVRPRDWPAGSGYAHGLLAEGRVLFVAGQIGWDATSHVVAAGGLVAQTRQALENIVAVLAAGDARPDHIVRLTWFITDRDAYVRDRKAIGTVYREVIGRHFPTMSVIVVAGLLEPGALVEIEATAVIP
jgi:enamine deaminase RidA (YjgF/YER057c/UK114 family)